jgi:hypothetical protein
MGERKGAYRFWWGDVMKEHHLEDLRLDGSVILIYICKKWDGGGMG